MPEKNTYINNLNQIPSINKRYDSQKFQKINIENGILYDDSKIYKTAYFLTGFMDKANFENFLSTLELHKRPVRDYDLARIFEFVGDSVRVNVVDKYVVQSFGSGAGWFSFEGMCSDVYWSGVYDARNKKIYAFVGY